MLNSGVDKPANPPLLSHHIQHCDPQSSGILTGCCRATSVHSTTNICACTEWAGDVIGTALSLSLSLSGARVYRENRIIILIITELLCLRETNMNAQTRLVSLIFTLGLICFTRSAPPTCYSRMLELSKEIMNTLDKIHRSNRTVSESVPVDKSCCMIMLWSCINFTLILAENMR